MDSAPSDNDRTTATLGLIRRMEEAINRHDMDAFMALCTDDVVWETTTPPDGERFEGQAVVRAALEGFLRGSPEARFETEEAIALGDHASIRWRYTWKNADGTSGHVRGVDLLLVRDGKIAETLAYVKG